MTASATTERILRIADRCDTCGAQAFVLAKFGSGELMFCGHHFSKYELNIRNQAYEIVDERSWINAKSESSPE